MRMHPCEAVARRRWAKIARIGYAIRQARRDRAPRLPICSNEKMATVGASDSVAIKSERSAEDLGGDASGLSSTMMPSSPVEAPAAPRRAEIPRGGGTMPPSRRQLEEWGRLAAPGLFDQLTHGGNRSAVAAVRWRDWRLDERRRQALCMARGLDADLTQRDRCPLAWSIGVCGLITYTLADFSPEFDRVLRRARDAGDFDFSAVPVRGPWGWRRRARLAGYR